MGATVNSIFEVRFTGTKSSNFGAVSIVERVVCGKSDGNMKDAHGQVLAHLSADKIAFPSNFGF